MSNQSVQRSIHTVKDALQGTVKPLTIETDLYGLAIEFPNGQFLVIDFCAGEFSINITNTDGECDIKPVARISCDE